MHATIDIKRSRGCSQPWSASAQADRENAMTNLPAMTARSWAAIRFAAALVLASTAVAADPDTLPRPRAKPEPRKLVVPDDAPAAKSQAAMKPASDSPSEVPKPEGRPGRAPDPPGTGKGDDAKSKDPKADAKKKEPPPPDGRCDQCGSCEGVRKVCVPKMIEKEIKKVCWDAKCEDFCIPGPSVWCGKACNKDDCGCWTHDLWKPTCAEVKTRVVPVRRETKRKVPAVEWKVEERCACCRRKPCELAANPPLSEKVATEEKGPPTGRP
jgi:hypothetical protein